MRGARSGSSLMAKMPRFVRLVRVREPLVCGLDRIDVADEIGHGDVGRGQLLAIALVARQPGDRKVVTLLDGQPAAALARRRQRRVVDLASGDDRHPLVEQVRQRAEDTRLGLAAQPEQDDVVPGEDGIVDGRDDRPFVAVDARKQRLPAGDGREQIAPHLIFDRGDAVTGCAQLAEGVDVHGVGSFSLSSGMSRLNSFMARFRSPRANRTSASTARSIPRFTDGSSSAVKSSRT